MVDGDFGRSPSSGHQHTVSVSGSGAGFCCKHGVEETGTVLVDTTSGTSHRSVERRGIFDFEVKRLSRASVVNEEYHHSFPTKRHREFTPGVQNPDQGATRVDNVGGVTLKVEVLLGLAFEFQLEWNRRSRKRGPEMGTTFTN